MNHHNLQKTAMVERLREMHHHWRKSVLLRGAARSVLLSLVAIIAACLLDMVAQLNVTARIVLAGATYSGIALIFWHNWLRHWIRPFSPRRIAWILEETFPTLNEKLISSVELAETDDPHVSFAMIERVLDDAELDLYEMRPEEIFAVNWRHFSLASAMVIAFVIAVCIPPLHMPTRLGRVMLPSDRDPSLGTLHIRLDLANEVHLVEGDPFTVTATVSDPHLDHLELVIQGERMRRVLMQRRNRERATFEIELDGIHDNFLLWAESGGSKSRTHTAFVTKRPAIREFSISYHFPPYTRLSPVSVMAGSGDLRALRNTRVDLQIHTTKPLREMTLAKAGRHIPVTLTPDGTTGRVRLTVSESGAYSVTLVDHKGLRNLKELTYRIVAIPDNKPSVTLTAPSTDLNLDPNASVTVAWEATDDFGIEKQALIIRVDDGSDPESIEIAPAQRTFELDLGALELSPGQLLDLAIRVEDGAENTAMSEHRRVLVGGGRRLRQANRYLETAALLDRHLRNATRHVEQIDPFTGRLAVPTSEWDHGSDHYARMFQAQLTQLGETLRRAQLTTVHLKQLGFFQKNSYSTELMRRYLEQERLFTLKNARFSPAQTDTQALRRLVQLNREMCEALREKARQHTADLELPLLLRNLQFAERSVTPRALRERLTALVSKSRTLGMRDVGGLQRILEEFDGSDDAVAATLQKAVPNLNAMIQANRQDMANYNRIDEAAAAIEAELQSLAKQFHLLAAALRTEPDAENWNRLQGLAESFRTIAEEAEHPVKKANNELAADVLLSAAESQNPEAIERLADALPTLTEKQDLHETRETVARARQRIAQAAASVPHDAAGEQASEAAAKALEEAGRALSQALADVQDLRRLHDELPTKPVEDALQRASQQAALAEQSAADAEHPENLRQAQAHAEQAVQAAVDAEEQLDKLAESKAHEQQLARRSLEKLKPTESDRFAQVRDNLNEAAANMAGSQTTTGETVAQLEAARKELDALAESLRNQAMTELTHPTGDLDAAAQKAALAAVADSLRSQGLAESAEALRNAAQLRSDAQSDDALEAAAAEEDRARKSLRNAAEELHEAHRLAQRHERARDGQLSLRETREVHRDIMQAAGRHVPENLVADFDTLKEIQAARRNLANIAERMDSSPQPGASDLGDMVKPHSDDAKRQLLRAMADRHNEPFLDAAETLLQTARDETDTLLSNVREARETGRHPQQRGTLTDRQPELAQQQERTREAVAQAAAMQNVLMMPDADMQERFDAHIAPPLRQALQKMARNQPPTDDLNQAADGLRQLRDDLDAALARLPEKPPMAPAARRPSAPLDLPAIQEAADEMALRLHEAGTARQTQKALEDALDQNQARAAAALRSIADDDVIPERQPEFDTAREVFAQGGLPEKTAALENVKELLLAERQDERDLLDQAVQDLSGGRESQRRAAQLAETFEQERRAMDSLARQMQQNLPRDGTPQIEHATKALDRFRDNVALNDLPAAERNLDAFRSTLRDEIAERAMASAAPETPGGEQPPQAAMPRRPAQPTPLERAKALLDSSPEDMGTPTVEQIPAQFREPRTPLPQRQEDALRTLAGSDPQKFLETTDRLVAQTLDEVQQAHDALRQGDPDTWETVKPAIHDNLQKMEAGRSTLGETDFPANRIWESARQAGDRAATAADPDRVEAVEKATGELTDLSRQLQEYRQDLAHREERAKQIAEWNEQLDGLQEIARDLHAATPPAEATDPETGPAGQAQTAQELTEQRQAAMQQAERLREEMSQSHSIPARQASEALQKAYDDIAQNQPATALEHLAETAHGLERMTPPMRQAIPLNEEALEATATAHQLGNRDAVEKARAGDYSGAEASMTRLAENLSDRAMREAAEEAGAGFREAREAQLEALPPDLQAAIANATHAIEQLTPAAAQAARKGLDNARAGQLEQASVHIDQADRIEQRPELQHLSDALAEAHHAEQMRKDALPPKIREADELISELAAATDPIAAATTVKARQALADNEHERAAADLREAIPRLDTLGQKMRARRAADLLDQAHREAYGDMNQPARRAVRALSEPDPEIIEAARQQDYELAARLAAESGQQSAAEKFAEAAQHQRQGLAPMTRAALDNIDTALQSEAPPPSEDQRELLAQARSAAFEDDLMAAAMLARQAVSGYDDEVRIADQLQELQENERMRIAPMQRAREAAERNRFNQALDHLAETAVDHTDAANHARNALRRAQNAVDSVVRGAMSDAFTDPEMTSNEQEALRRAAREAAVGNMEAALEHAAASGPAAERATAALNRTQAIADTARAAVDELAQPVTQNAQRRKQATEQDVADALASLQSQAEESAQAHESARSDAGHLDEAAAHLAAGRESEARAALESIPQGRHILPLVEDALPQASADTGAEGPAQTPSTAAADMLKDAAQAAAARADRAAGQLAAIEQRQALFEDVSGALAANDFARALETAKHAAGPALYAARAAELFDQGARLDEPSQRTAETGPDRRMPDAPRAQEPSRQPASHGADAESAQSSSGEIIAPNAAAAIANVQAAETALDAEPVADGEARERLSSAQRHLARTVEALRGSIGQQMSGMGQGAQSSGPQPPTLPALPRQPVGELAESWQGAPGALAGDGQTEGTNAYDAYYRDAIREYLRQVAEASKKWQEN